MANDLSFCQDIIVSAGHLLENKVGHSGILRCWDDVTVEQEPDRRCDTASPAAAHRVGAGRGGAIPLGKLRSKSVSTVPDPVGVGGD